MVMGVIGCPSISASCLIETPRALQRRSPRPRSVDDWGITGAEGAGGYRPELLVHDAGLQPMRDPARLADEPPAGVAVNLDHRRRSEIKGERAAGFCRPSRTACWLL